MRLGSVVAVASTLGLSIMLGGPLGAVIWAVVILIILGWNAWDDWHSSRGRLGR